ncbi:DUF2243 domain-containing protein [Phyllobacterium phragmitis]|uniref:DUF2243 domain-containing protein n=1 Tax=Phyllobacterium phragmitis TaxID=2670329 RepID=A0ABQ0H3Q2_9HYPH
MNTISAPYISTSSGNGLAAFLLGFSIGGFFDGILLHQILQWHHLLSGIAGRAQDLRFQIVAGRRVLAVACFGFASWHLIDAVLSHWLLGIHRIRMDSPNPLLWDIGWLFVFGLVPALIGYGLLRNAGPASGPPTGGRLALSLLLASGMASGLAALMPPRGNQPAAVLFGASASQAEIMRAIQLTGGTLVSSNPSGTLWLVHFENPLAAYRLYGQGALFVGGTMAGGCLSYTRWNANA